MKSKIATLLCMTTIAFGAVFSGCKKDKELTTQEKMEGKWAIDAAIGSYTMNGQINRDTTYFTSADFVQFNNDGSIKIEESGEAYAGKWALSNNKVLISETEYIDYPGGFSIIQLTDKQFELHYIQQDGTTTLEQKLKLKR